MFHLHQSRYYRFSMVQQSLSRLQRIRSRWFLLFNKQKVPFLLIYLLPTHKKCNHKKNHAYHNLVYSICHRVDIYRPVKFPIVSYILFHIIRPICFFSSVKKFVNKVNDAWLIKTNSFPIGEFIFIVNADWRRTNWMLITHFNKS